MGFDIYISLFHISQYRERVEPALRNYFATGERGEIVGLLEEVKQLSTEPSTVIQSSINILNGKEFYCPSLKHVPSSPGATTSREDLDYHVRYAVKAELLQGLCVAKIDGHNAEQNMGRSPLIPYLYERSSWIESSFTGGILDTGTRLDFPLGEHAEVMASKTVETLLSELNAVPFPDPYSMPEVAKGYSNLKRILMIAMQESDQIALLYLA